jgi:hypothetical protein
MTDSKHWFAALALAFYTALVTTASADTRTFELTGFDGVVAAEGLHVFVTTGAEFEVTATSDSLRQLERLELDIRGTTLTAGMENRSLSVFRNKGSQVSVWITLPNLVQAEVSSGSELSVDVMNGLALELAGSSGGILLIETIDGETISANFSSGAEIEIGVGTCGSLSADVSSGALLGAENVSCAEVMVDASSGSNVSVNAERSIDANASSGAIVRVCGAHELTEVETSSGGSIDFP